MMLVAAVAETAPHPAPEIGIERYGAVYGPQ